MNEKAFARNCPKAGEDAPKSRESNFGLRAGEFARFSGLRHRRGLHFRTDPKAFRKQSNREQKQLTADKCHQPFKCPLREAVRVKTYAQHVYAEPRPACPDV